MLAGFKAYGQSPEDGAKPLVYACCAPEEDLRGKHLHQIRSDSQDTGSVAFLAVHISNMAAMQGATNVCRHAVMIIVLACFWQVQPIHALVSLHHCTVYNDSALED